MHAFLEMNLLYQYQQYVFVFLVNVDLCTYQFNELSESSFIQN